ncbi:MAG TPA: hypothetical protein VHG08_21255 [Longimicrobium sp.]|nr:hypothetical protein [Longimicrobium sp.]
MSPITGHLARVLVLILLVCAPVLAAQPRTQPADGLSARMQAFLTALGEHPRDSLVSFLPRRGEWTWVVTTHTLTGDRIGLWRFGKDDLLPAIEETGPLCDSFSWGGDVMLTGTLMSHVIRNRGPWRRVPGNRFVPPGASVRAPVFVEWRREDGQWVFSAYGDERRRGPRLLGHSANEVVRDAGPRSPPPAEETADARYAAGAPWYEHNGPLVVDGVSLDRYGAPRPLSPGELVRFGTVHGVPAYVEPGSTGTPGVVYVPVSHGVYQPYQAMAGTGCW